MQGVANGTGPNPAQAMLAQQTGQNVSNQAALMAGQRGAGANAGLMARQAGMQGGALQQQAVGQGASLQANQSLNALNQMGGIANTQAHNQIGQTNANVGSNLGLYQQEIAKQANLNQGNTALTLQNMQQGESAVGGMMNGMSSMPMMMGAGGGEAGKFQPPQSPTPQMAEGGELDGPQSEFGQFLTGSMNLGNYAIPNSVMQSGSSKGSQPAGQSPQSANSGEGGSTGVIADSGQTGMGPTSPGSSSGIGSFTSGTSGAMAPAFKKGGMVKVVVSPGEKVVEPGKAKKAAEGNIEAKTVPGKAKVPGDSYENDVVSTKLPAGSIVIPRSKATNEKDAASFVRSVLAKRGRK